MSKKNKRIGGTYGRFTTCLSTTLVLLMLGAIVFFVMMAHNFSHQLRSNVPLEVMLHDSIQPAQQARLEQFLKAQTYVDSVRFMSKSEATREMSEAMDESPADFMGYSPVPAEYEVYLKSEVVTMEDLRRIAPQIKRQSGVTDVDYPRDTLESLDATIPVVTLVLLIVAGVLTIVSFSLINNSVRMGIYARRVTIHSMRLVGARRSFIRRPFMVSAFWLGFIAAVVAGGLIATGIYFLSTLDMYASQLITWQVWALTLGAVFFFGIFISLVCTFFSVNRFLNMREEDLFLK